MDPQNQQNYQLKLDEDLTQALHEATAKKVILLPLFIGRTPQLAEALPMHACMQRSFGMNE
jgi:hypothetical protein